MIPTKGFIENSTFGICIYICIYIIVDDDVGDDYIWQAGRVALGW